MVPTMVMVPMVIMIMVIVVTGMDYDRAAR